MNNNDLWGYTNGEPFLENPYLAVVNPTRKRGKKKAMARTIRRRRRTANPRRRRRRAAPRARRNAYVLGGEVARRNPPRRRKRRTVRARRNPTMRMPAIMGVQLPSLQSILWTGAGFVAPPMVEGFVGQFIPADWQQNAIGRYAVKIGTVVGLTYLTKTVVGAKESREVAIGGGIYVATSAIADFMPDLVPGLQEYVPSSNLSSYVDSGSKIGHGITPLPSKISHAPRFNRFGQSN